VINTRRMRPRILLPLVAGIVAWYSPNVMINVALAIDDDHEVARQPPRSTMTGRRDHKAAAD
jgi:hypothetical protein